jgi:uncharacterized membrane protein YeaQ/YmgE (transglycosylase-associated protein family)
MLLNLNSLLVWIIVGGVGGFMAEWSVGDIRTGMGTVLVGVAGGLLGGWLFDYFQISLGLTGILNDILTSLIGAGILLLLVKFIRRV